jgi:hypothetical protein
MTELVRLLKDLGKDAKLADAYAKDPDAVLSEYDLTEAEVNALKAGDLDKIRAASGLEELHMTNTTVKSY